MNLYFKRRILCKFIDKSQYISKMRIYFSFLFSSGNGVPNEVTLEPSQGDQLGSQESLGSDGGGERGGG